MNDPEPRDTFDRSLDHWSERGRATMNAFYAVATSDYRRLAEAWDWGAHLAKLKPSGGPILDVACGSGKFPAALSQHAGLGELLKPGQTLELDLLDPSAFSIEETARTLTLPFVAGKSLCVTLQDLTEGGYPLLWAVHGLYAIPPAELDSAMEKLLAARAPGGMAFIAQARRTAHYVHFHDLYLRNRTGLPYSAAEDVLAALERAGASVEVTDLTYNGVVDASQPQVLEGYLQRCLFDDRLSFDDMQKDSELGPYLDSCRTSAGSYRFPQQVAMIFIRDAKPST